jgi:hypothetical protein
MPAQMLPGVSGFGCQSSGNGIFGFARATKEGLSFFGILVVIEGLPAILAGVAVVFGRGADLAGLPFWHG